MFNYSSPRGGLEKVFVSPCPPPQQASIHYVGSSKRISNAPHLYRLSQRTPPNISRPSEIPQGIQLRQNYRTTTSSNPYQQTWDEMIEPEEKIERDLFVDPFSVHPERKAVTDGPSISDNEAAMQMEICFRRRARRRQHQLTGRILRDLITRRDTLDDDSLHNLLFAADKIIFDGKLCGRVRWKWSEPDEQQYEHELLGTTALRRAPPSIGGFQTQIVLSKPLLQNKKFNRDLLLSAFFHELVHCYLFIQCGLDHALHDGHTAGFRKIASLIDKWFGHQRLHLCNMRANLDHFRVREETGCGHPQATFINQKVMSPAYVSVQDYMMGSHDQKLGPTARIAQDGA